MSITKKIYIGPFDNHTKPDGIPDKWWEDYKDWLPKRWLGFPLPNGTLHVLPYFALEVDTFGGFENYDPIILYLEGVKEARVSDISQYIKKSKRQTQYLLARFLSEQRIKCRQKSKNDPHTVYYIEKDDKK